MGEVVTKFKVNRVERYMGGSYVTNPETGKQEWKSAEVQNIVLCVVSGGGPDSENAKFFASTPTGKIELGTINAEAAKEFDLEGEFYVTFRRVEKAAQ
jgi:hypothetical protein